MFGSYTHYSVTHYVCCGIDYFLMNVVNRHQKISLLPAQQMSLTIRRPIYPGVRWLNTSILNNENIIKDTRREISECLQENKNSLVESALIWDAVKVIMRGWSMKNYRAKQLETDVAREAISKWKKLRQKLSVVYLKNRPNIMSQRWLMILIYHPRK